MPPPALYPRRPAVQVRSDCPPKQLVEFLVSDGSMLADQVRALAAWRPHAGSMARRPHCAQPAGSAAQCLHGTLSCATHSLQV